MSEPRGATSPEISAAVREAMGLLWDPWGGLTYWQATILCHRLAGETYAAIAQHYERSEGAVRERMCAAARLFDSDPNGLIRIAAQDGVPAIPLPRA